MHRRAVGPPAALKFSLLAIAASSHGCGGAYPYSGSRILNELARDHVPVPDEAGNAPASGSTPSLPASGPLSLADLLIVADGKNPALAAARSEVGIAAGRAWQASMYPNPRVDVATEDLSWRDGASNAKTTVGLTQPIVLGERRHAAIKAADAERLARLAEVEQARTALFGEMTLLYSRLVVIRDQEQLYSELHGLVARTLSSAQARFDARAAPETDVIRPRVELYRIEAELARLKQDRASLAKELSLLIGCPPIDPLRLDGSVSLTPDAMDAPRLESVARRSHPSLAAADGRVEVAAAKLEQVRAERTPDLEVRVGVGYDGELDSGVVDLGAGITVPLWDQREGDSLAARFELMQARQARAQAENELLRRLAGAIGEYDAARSQLDTFRDRIVPDAQRSFEQTTEAYRAGRAAFLDLLDAQRTLTEARVTLAELAGAAASARARVIQIVGPDALMPAPGAAHAIARDSSSLPSPVRPQGQEITP